MQVLEDLLLTTSQAEGLAHSPARALALTAHAELVAQGWSDYETLPADYEVIYAVMSGEVGGGAFDAFIVGCIVFYEPEDEEGLIWEALTYVKPVWRRRGVYRKLWTALVKEVQERHVTKISGSVHVENFGMRAAALKIGRRCNFMIYDYEV